jgi:hypothetical protein
VFIPSWRCVTRGALAFCHRLLGARRGATWLRHAVLGSGAWEAMLYRAASFPEKLSV